MLTKNAASIPPGGQYYTVRWEDLVGGKKTPDTRTGEEIVADIVRRAGLTVLHSGGA